MCLAGSFRYYLTPYLSGKIEHILHLHQNRSGSTHLGAARDTVLLAERPCFFFHSRKVVTIRVSEGELECIVGQGICRKRFLEINRFLCVLHLSS